MRNILLRKSAALVIFLVLILFFIEKSQGETFWSTDKRFKDNGNLTITDTKTGLMWMKKDSYLHSGHWANWFESIHYVRQLNENGFANQYDWQVPTLKQLTTIFEAGKTNSKVLGSGMTIHIDPVFAKRGSASLWTIEENGNYNAFGIILNTGEKFNSSKTSKFRKAVRAVRHLN